MLIVRHYRTILTMLKSFGPLVTELDNLAEAVLAFGKYDENLARRIAGSKIRRQDRNANVASDSNS